jgi:hypothetical protein
MIQNFIMRPRRDFLRIFSLFLCACVLAGCSALRLGYSNGESVVYWWLDGYVDFSADQKPWVKERIDRLFAWHRRTQLPDYAQLLSQFRRRLQQEATPAQMLADAGALRQRALATVQQALPDLADLALSLEPQQIAHLAQKFEANNAHYRKKHLRGDREDRQAHRFKQVMKHAEYWFGDFSAEQEARIRAASDARPLDNEMWLKERQRRQQALLDLLKKIQSERPSREAVIALLQAHLDSFAEWLGYQENKAFFDASRDGNAQLAATIVNLATPEQKAHATRRLQKLIEDCHAMSAMTH